MTVIREEENMLGRKACNRLTKLITYILLTMISLVCVFPFLWMVITALKPETEVRQAVPSLIIHQPTIENLLKVLFDTGFVKYMRNSFVVASAATILSMIIAVMAGYVLSRYYKRRIVKLSNVGMMISQMIPGVLLLVPLYITMQKIGLLESYFSLILAYTTFVIPLCLSLIHISEPTRP